MTPSRSARYTSVAIGLHWAMAAALVGMIVLGGNMHDLPNSDPIKKSLYQLHKSVGITILFLTLARLVWRFRNPPPPTPPMPLWQKYASSAVHWAFYALMLLMPLTGWLLVSAAPLSLPTVLFGLVDWPHIPGLSLAAKRAIFPILETAHGKLPWLVLALLALHVSAALKHQFVDKDGLLARMAPGLFGPSDPPIAPARGAWLAFGGCALVFAIITMPGILYTLVRAGGEHDAPHLIRVDANWTVRAEDSHVGFSGVHDDRAFSGKIGRWYADIRFEPDGSKVNAIEAWFDLLSTRTGDAYYDKALASQDWFGLALTRYAYFNSTAMRPIGANAYIVDGELRIKNRAFPISFPATVVVDGDTSLARFSFNLDRIDLGIGVSSDPDAEWVDRVVTVSASIRADRIPRR